MATLLSSHKRRTHAIPHQKEAILSLSLSLSLALTLSRSLSLLARAWALVAASVVRGSVVLQELRVYLGFRF